MSYRAFKRLLGETSLERKTRFLLGLATLALITASFYIYNWYTEDTVYQQADAAARQALAQAVAKAHARLDLPPEKKSLLDTLPKAILRDEPEPADEFITSKTKDAEKLAKLDQARQIADPEQNLLSIEPLEADRRYTFILRAGDACLKCHQEKQPDLKKGEVLGLAVITMPSRELQSGVHRNRALLISTAFVSAILLMTGSYLIVRYVIVKPVKHLKDVSDAISQGQLNIRSEIQTGDEFEDLSHAFNRMLRTLVTMQDQLRRVNTDLDRKVDELAQANMALYSSYQLKSDFLATMSHELRTPLNSILGFSDLLHAQKLTDKQKRWVENINTSGKHLLSLITEILDLAKMEAGKMQVKPEEFSLRDVLEGLVAMFRPQADQKNIDLECKIDPGLPPLKQDPGKLQQILWNLLSNAVKFTPEGGRVTVDADTDGLHLLLSISDTGVGIAPEDQEAVFEKFRQTSRTLTREQGGTGLGLSIVRELAKLLGGEVKLQSDLGRGSTFTVTIPLVLHVEPRVTLDLNPVEPPPLPRDVRLFAPPPEEPEAKSA